MVAARTSPPTCSGNGARAGGRAERHAEGCERCREQIRWLRPAVAAIAEAAPRREPPPELRRRLLEEVEADTRAGAEVEAGSGLAPPGAASASGWAAPGPALAGDHWRPGWRCSS